MSEYPNSGALFKNDRKRNDKSPSHTGSTDIVCPHCGAETSFWLSAWVKVQRSGAKFFSLSYTAKDEIGHRTPANSGNDASENDLYDDIPFSVEAA